MSVIWLFPGQGSQHVGMGKALAEASAAAKEVFERADSALGRSISALCFDGPEADLTLTFNAQPAIVTTSIAALAALREAYPDLPLPRCAAGHSLGEYSALVAAEALQLEDAVRLVELRGRAMQEAVPAGQGAMAAIVGGDEAAVRALCEIAAQGETLAPANFNAPGQIVIAGAAAAVERAVALCADHKLKGIPLKVSAPFHCALMKPAAERLDAALEKVQLRKLAFAVVSNVEGLENDASERVRELLVRQVASPVKWEASIRRARDLGVARGLEIGPGKVLSGLVRRIDKTIGIHNVSSPQGVAHARGFLGG